MVMALKFGTTMRTLAPADLGGKQDLAARKHLALAGARQRTTIPQACTACRQRKTKCNGTNPCPQCQNKATVCTYEHRPRPHELQTALKDKDAEIAGFRRILTTLRLGPQPEADHLLCELRQSHDLDEFIANQRNGQASPFDIKHAQRTIEIGGRSTLALGWSQNPIASSLPPTSQLQEDEEGFGRMNWHPALRHRSLQAEPLQPSSVPLDPFDQSQWSSEDIYQFVSQTDASSTVPSPWQPVSTEGIYPDIFSTARGSDETFQDTATVKYESLLPKAFHGNRASALVRGRHIASNFGYATKSVTHPGGYPANGYVQVFGNLPMSSGVMAAGYPDDIRDKQLETLKLPEYLIMPLTGSEESHLGVDWVDFLERGRLYLSNSEHIKEELLGPNEVCVDDLFMKRESNEPLTVAAWMCNFIEHFRYTETPLRLAAVVLLTRLMRWMICPTAETYALVPKLMRPTLAQRLIPHFPAVDTVFLPNLRDHLAVHFEDYLTPLMGRCTVEWPYGIDAAIQTDPHTLSRSISRTFEDHVSNLANWTVTSDCLDKFPMLAECIRVIEPTHGEHAFYNDAFQTAVG